MEASRIGTEPSVAANLHGYYQNPQLFAGEIPIFAGGNLFFSGVFSFFNG
jgi:hypothetical protein